MKNEMRDAATVHRSESHKYFSVVYACVCVCVVDCRLVFFYFRVSHYLSLSVFSLLPLLL